MNKLNINTKKTIEESEWSRFVSEVYKRPYSFQQQGGCMDRGIYTLIVPTDDLDDCNNQTAEECCENDDGVAFIEWVNRDPELPVPSTDTLNRDKWYINLWWERNFYPNIDMVANDLYKKGLLEEGEYVIIIDW